MTTPIFDELNELYLATQRTAKLQAQADLAKALKDIPKPTKQVAELIRKLENGELGS